MVAVEVIAMKQALLWTSEGDQAAARWKRLPDTVRRDLIAQLTRLVVDSLVRSDKVEKTKEKKR